MICSGGTSVHSNNFGLLAAGQMSAPVSRSHPDGCAIFVVQPLGEDVEACEGGSQNAELPLMGP